MSGRYDATPWEEDRAAARDALQGVGDPRIRRDVALDVEWEVWR